jgi:hypothetical protein
MTILNEIMSCEAREIDDPCGNEATCTLLNRFGRRPVGTRVCSECAQKMVEESRIGHTPLPEFRAFN